MTKPDEQQMREGFEARKIPHLNLKRRPDGSCYHYDVTAMAFRDFCDGAAWQQSRQSDHSADVGKMVKAAQTEDGIKTALQKIELAEKKVSALCHGEEKWVMSIPARPDHDPDIVISDALHSAKAALSALSALSALGCLPSQVKELQQERDAALGILSIDDLPPEGQRTKLDEWQACYAALFRQIHPVMKENRRLKERLGKAESALQKLILTKHMKDTEGKSTAYEAMRTEAWQMAAAALTGG